LKKHMALDDGSGAELPCSYINENGHAPQRTFDLGAFHAHDAILYLIVAKR
jgi:hypothetical protein